ncbi:hypothetical protein D3877_01840 [Azospirillum cavernae]|uniref:Uncharacterized protein n=1 Tax=Azospirillum cavernae TaxID=2320860 RepID=A0A418W085_9PROT|nr:hypothetical protein [Azospirillum cavernae]RJF83437.1 hypothetical protein D3877_01840 [Azospirillum cavernae]
MPATAALMPLFLAYQRLAQCPDAEAVDGMLGVLEPQIANGAITTLDDLFAKARYLQETSRIDPALIPAEALDTLVAGILRLFHRELSQTLPLVAAA